MERNVFKEMATELVTLLYVAVESTHFKPGCFHSHHTHNIVGYIRSQHRNKAFTYKSSPQITLYIPRDCTVILSEMTKSHLLFLNYHCQNH